MYHGLVGGFNLTILKNISQVGDIGRMTSHILWKKKVPNHQPVGNSTNYDLYGNHGAFNGKCMDSYIR